MVNLFPCQVNNPSSIFLSKTAYSAAYKPKKGAFKYLSEELQRIQNIIFSAFDGL